MIITKKDIVRACRNFGINSEIDLMLHSSLSSLGPVLNGPNDVIDGLLESIGSRGTLLMPAHTGQTTDPESWKSPKLPNISYIVSARENLRPFDIQTTPIRGRGIIPETFRSYPNVYRSDHPLNSVIAKGLNAALITSKHELNESEGIDSPIGAMYQLKQGYIMLMGVGLKRCTAIHLAEYMANVPYLYGEDNPVVNISKLGEQNKFQKLIRYPKTSENFDRIWDHTGINRYLKCSVLGKSKLIFFELNPVIDQLVNILIKNPYFLLES